ncbi:Down syndrome cell adhesion molecule-like protein Dscam2 [Folsomia candida]|uniref:Down syndrome cell adhesion molecule-like protein Dscam2 n=1 Tax=Folsomia candida TaxID=158441 RepID=A0A226EGX2_FOLCA|nr:Down syndrome cell adhesion molecule-like protein Dscam2 [Folsomia candida]
MSSSPINLSSYSFNGWTSRRDVRGQKFGSLWILQSHQELCELSKSFTPMRQQKEPEGPQAVRILGQRETNLRVRAGEEMYLSCHAEGNPPPSFSWYREIDGVLSDLPPTSKRPPSSSPSSSPQNSVVHVAQVRPQDAGSYLCRANNSHSVDQALTQLVVYVPLRVQVSPPTQIVDVGRSTSLRCLVSGSPIYSLVWLKDGVPLAELENGPSSSPRFEVGPREVLKLVRVQPDDAGMYQCLASNDFTTGQDSSQIRLGSVLPELVYRFSEQTIQPGPSVSLKCTAVGNPPPQFTWTLDGFALPESERFLVGQYVTIHDNVISHVNITQARDEDGGLYACQARNAMGIALHTGRLNIYGPPFVRPVPPIKGVAGKNLQIQCPVSGYPIESISWERGGSLLPVTRMQRVYPNGTLILEHLQKTDEGILTCHAKGRQGQISSRDIHLRVVVPPKLMPFQFLNTVLREGMRAAVSCQLLEGDRPIDLVWEFDGKPISGGVTHGIMIRVPDEYSSTLVIDSLSSVHNGKYTCIAENSAGREHYSSELTVQIPPKWILEPRDVNVSAGHSFSLQCRAEGHPTPSITWKRATAGMQPGDYKYILSPTGSSSPFANGTIRFDQVRKSDEGNYLCEARNDVGSGLSKVIFLKVNAPAKFNADEQAVNSVISVRVGEKAILGCRVGGDLPILIEWGNKHGKIGPHSNHRYTFRQQELEDGILSELLIASVDRSDSGAYSCRASNPFGSDHTIVTLNVQEELSHIKKQMFNFKSDLDRFINKFIGLEQQVKKNAETILRYETKPNANCDRQCNIIIHGCEYYSAKIAMEETTDFLSNCFEVDVTVKDVRPLSNGKSVLVKLSSTKQKSMVFRNCHKLKAIPAKISIVEDLSKEERAKKRRQIPEFLEQKKIENKVYFRGADLFLNGTKITEEIIISPYHDVSHSVTAQTKPMEKTEKLDHAKCGQPPVEKDIQPEKDDQPDTHYLEGPHLKDVKPTSKLSQPISDDGVAYILSIMDANMKSLTREIDACLTLRSSLVICGWLRWGADRWGFPGWKTSTGTAPSSTSSFRASSPLVGQDFGGETTIDNLRKFTRYAIVVQAFNAKGAGPSSSPTVATTLQDVPTQPPEKFECRSTSPQSLALTWEPPPLEARHGVVQGYKVDVLVVGGQDEGPGSEAESGDGIETKVTTERDLVLHGLRKWTNYSVTVRGFTVVGDGAVSTPLLCRTDEDVRKIACNQEVRSPNLGRELGYRDDVTPAHDAICAAYTETGLTIWGRCLRWARRYCSLGVSVKSVLLSGSQLIGGGIGGWASALAFPSPPSDLKAVVSSRRSILVSWLSPANPNGKVTKFTVYSRISDGTKVEKKLVSFPDLRVEWVGLKEASTYEFWVSCTTRVGEGTPTKRIKATTPANNKVFQQHKLLFTWGNVRLDWGNVRFDWGNVRLGWGNVRLGWSNVRLDWGTVKIAWGNMRRYYVNIATLWPPSLTFTHSIKVFNSLTQEDNPSPTESPILTPFGYVVVLVSAKIATFSGTVEIPWKKELGLDCVAVGVPEPTVEWSFNGGGEIYGGNAKREVQPSSGGNTKLVVKDVGVEDGGNYTCTATNAHGSESVVYAVKVQTPPEAPILQVIEVAYTSIKVVWSTPHSGGSQVRGQIATLLKKLRFHKTENPANLSVII